MPINNMVFAFKKFIYLSKNELIMLNKIVFFIRNSTHKKHVQAIS